MTLDKTYTEFNNIINELDNIEAYHELDNLRQIFAVNRGVHDKYLDTRHKLAALLLEIEAPMNPSFYEANTSHLNRSHDSEELNTSSHHTEGKLPQNQMTPFDGKYEKWP